MECPSVTWRYCKRLLITGSGPWQALVGEGRLGFILEVSDPITKALARQITFDLITLPAKMVETYCLINQRFVGALIVTWIEAASYIATIDASMKRNDCDFDRFLVLSIVFTQESMKLMGMKAWLHWLAWFVKFSVFMIISVAFMTLFFHIKVNGRAVITKTDPSITFVFLLLYSLSIVTFCFAISTFFSKGLISLLCLFVRIYSVS
jgi:hypothetical protein